MLDDFVDQACAVDEELLWGSGLLKFLLEGLRGFGFTLALFVGLLGGAVLCWHPLFCRIILLVHPCWRRINVVASALGGAS